MGFFDFKLDDKEIAVPESEKKPEAQTSTKQQEVKKMSGYSDIKQVARDAPSSYDQNAAPASAPRRGRQSAAAMRASEEDRKRAEDEAREKRIFEILAPKYCDMLARMPYKMWAAYAHELQLNLTEDEAKEIADLYFKLAEAMKPKMSSPWVMVFGIGVAHVGLVLPRLRLLEEKAQKESEHEETSEPEIKTDTKPPLQ